MVRLEGLEPPRLATPEPKSGVSTNFTTAAARDADYIAGLNPKGQPLSW